MVYIHDDPVPNTRFGLEATQKRLTLVQKMAHA